jgi:hypothetical protein
VLFSVLVFVHVALMFTAVSVSYGGVVFFLIALRTGNVASLRTMALTANSTAKLIPPLYGLAGIFGLVAAIYSGINLLTPWLVIAYVLFIVLTLIGAVYTGPTIKRIGASLAAADQTLPADIVVSRTRFYRMEVIDFFFLFLIIFDMVIKPFSP